MILITGGGGFIGSFMAEFLIENGFEIRIVDNFSTGNRKNIPPNVDLIVGDLREAELIDRCLKDIEYVFHFAAQTKVPKSVKDPLFDFDNNCRVTLSLLEKSLKYGVEKFIFSSSAAVYGTTGHNIREEHPKNPKNPYGLSKLAAEEYCKMFHSLYDLKTIILRYFNVYGPRKYNNVIGTFLQNIKRNEPLFIYGDGKQFRDFVFIKDAVKATFLCFEKGKPGEAYNIGTGVDTTIIELSKLISESFEKNSKIIFKEKRPGDTKGVTANICKIKDATGFSPQYDLKTGLKDTYFNLPTDI